MEGQFIPPHQKKTSYVGNLLQGPGQQDTHYCSTGDDYKRDLKFIDIRVDRNRAVVVYVAIFTRKKKNVKMVGQKMKISSSSDHPTATTSLW